MVAISTRATQVDGCAPISSAGYMDLTARTECRKLARGPAPRRRFKVRAVDHFRLPNLLFKVDIHRQPIGPALTPSQESMILESWN